MRKTAPWESTGWNGRNENPLDDVDPRPGVRAAQPCRWSNAADRLLRGARRGNCRRGTSRDGGRIFWERNLMPRGGETERGGPKIWGQFRRNWEFSLVKLRQPWDQGSSARDPERGFVKSAAGPSADSYRGRPGRSPNRRASGCPNLSEPGNFPRTPNGDLKTSDSGCAQDRAWRKYHVATRTRIPTEGLKARE